MIFGGDYNEGCMFGILCDKNRYCLDLDYAYNCEVLYYCSDLANCYDCQYVLILQHVIIVIFAKNAAGAASVFCVSI